MPASQFVPENGPDNKRQSLGRANAAKFVTDLCKYTGSPRIIKQAQEHILDAHAERLTAELADLPGAPSDSAAQAWAAICVKRAYALGGFGSFAWLRLRSRAGRR